MHAAVAALEDRHHKVLVMTPLATAARETLPKDGFKSTHTVAHFLLSQKLQDDFRGGVWWVDEAGLLSSRDLYQLVVLADQCQARLIVSGDPQQHPSVDRGDSLRILQEHGGLEMVRVDKILRQEGEFKAVVEHLSEGRVVEGYKMLDSMGCILEAPDEERYKILAQGYQKAVTAREKVLAICPTHAEGRKVTEAIRQELKSAGELRKERAVPVLQPIYMSDGDRRDARAYRPGWVVEMVQNAKGFRIGERLTVTAVSEDPQGGVRVERKDGTPALLPVHKCGQHGRAFEWGTRLIAEGERIRITSGGKSLDGRFHLRAGKCKHVKGFTTEGDLKLDSGVVVARDFGHLTYGYVDTSFGAQGKSVDRVFLAESTESFGAANQRQFYVCIGRGRKPGMMVTDDKEATLEAVQTACERVAAMDVMTDAPALPFEEAVQLREAQQRAEARIGQTVTEVKTRDWLGNAPGVPPIVRETAEVQGMEREVREQTRAPERERDRGFEPGM
jgi:ATP-dependent exoDNAse (exonuclease V) alpha subunit